MQINHIIPHIPRSKICSVFIHFRILIALKKLNNPLVTKGLFYFVSFIFNL